jgi:hypothetical protein
MVKSIPTRLARIAVCVAVLALVGCAATTLQNSWRDPNYKGPPLKKVMVVGVSNQADTRRTFEDEFVKQLKADGVEGIQSYIFIPQNGKAEEAQVKEALQKSGADGVLITRLVRVDVNTQVVPAYSAAPGMGLYGGYTGAWGGYYEPAAVYQTDTLVIETSLYGAGDSVLLWSGTTQTFAPTNVKKDMADFAKVIIDALKKQKLIQ